MKQRMLRFANERYLVATDLADSFRVDVVSQGSRIMNTLMNQASHQSTGTEAREE